MSNDGDNSFTIAFSDTSDILDLMGIGGLIVGQSSITVSGTGGNLRNDTDAEDATTAAIAVTMTDTVGVLTLNSAKLNILGG